MTFIENVGTIAGGTLGYIVGDVPGAYLGAVAGRKLSQMKRSTHDERNVKRRRLMSLVPYRKKNQAMKAKKITIKRPYRYKVVRSVKPVRKNKSYSKAVKKAVSNALQCGSNVGTYHKSWVSEMPWLNITANTQIVVDYAQRAGGNTAPYTPGPLGFIPFTSLKMIDAASVLFNGKTPAINYDDLTGNFANGKKMKIDFTYCSFEMKITNVSPHAYEVKLYRGKARKDTSIGLKTQWDNALDAKNWPHGQPNSNTVNFGLAGLGPVASNWQVKTDTFVLKPGGTRTFKSVWKGCVEFSKHYTDANTIGTFMKGISESWVFVAKPTAALFGNRVAPGSNPTGAVSMTSSNSLAKAIVCETKEIFKMLQPDATEDQYEGNNKAFFVDYPYVADVNYTQVFSDPKNEIRTEL